MPGDDRTVRVDQDRVREPERTDGNDDLFELALRVGSRVAPAGNKGIDGPVGNGEWAVGEVQRLNIHSRILKEHIMNIKSKTFGWTCRRNRASVGSRPTSGLFAVAAGKHAIPLVRRAT